MSLLHGSVTLSKRDYLEEQEKVRKVKWWKLWKPSYKVWVFTQGEVKLWKWLMKDIAEIVCFSGFGLKPGKNMRKKPVSLSLLQMLYFRNKKKSLGDDALCSLLKHIHTWAKKSVKKLPTRWIFFFTLPTSVSANLSRYILTSAFTESFFASLSCGQPRKYEVLHFTSSLQTF